MRVLFFLLLVSLGCFSQKSIYFITCGPGEELYATFGHSAIWIYDSTAKVDEVYNFGTFDFETEGFYVKFTRGKLPYALDYSGINPFVGAYVSEMREVKAQKLALDSSQIETIHQLLLENIKEENRFYAYDFFFDNCSTRLRDLLEKALGEKLKWEQHGNAESKTLRQLLNPGVSQMPWTKWGFYLGLGSVTDKIATNRQMMFLPEHLFDAIETASLGEKKLVEDTFLFYRPESKPETVQNFFTTPIFFAILVSIVYTLLFLIDKRQKWMLKVENFFLISFGLLGLFIIFLWFGTDHQATKYNFNFLWASPLLLVHSMFKKTTWKKVTFIIISISFLMFSVVSVFKIQEFHMASYIFSIFIFLILLRQRFSKESQFIHN